MGFGSAYQRFQPGMINSSGPAIPILSNPQAHYSSPNRGFVSNSSGPGNEAGGVSPFAGVQNALVNSGITSGIREGVSSLMPDAVKQAFNENITYPLQDLYQPYVDTAKQEFANFTEPFRQGWADLTGSNVTAVEGGPTHLAGSAQVSMPQAVEMAELPAPTNGLLAPESYGPLMSEAPEAFTGATGATFAPESGSLAGIFASEVPDVTALGLGGTDAIGAGWGAGVTELGSIGGATAGAEAGATAGEGAAALAAASAESAPAWGPAAWIPLVIAAAAMADSQTGGHIIAAPMQSLSNLANGNPFSELGDSNWWGNISGYNTLFGDGGLFG